MNGGHRGHRRAGSRGRIGGTSAHGRSWARRRWWLLSGGLLVLLLVLGSWLGAAAVRTHSSLTATRDHLGLSATAVAAGDTATAQHEMTLASDAAADASAAASSIPWVVAGSIPVLGQPFGVTGELAAVTDDLIVQVLQPTLSSSTALVSGKLRPSGGRIDLGAIADSQSSLTKAAAAAGVLDDRARAIAHPRYIAAVEDARRALQIQISQLAGSLRTASKSAALLPPMLGAEGSRTYLLAFQTNAEARGTGGLVGGFGMLTADHGTLKMDTLASNTELETGKPPGIDLGPEYAQQYAGYSSTTLWSNANSSPHFPYAAQIWSSLWEQQTGRRIDGVIALDPLALSHILRATGPVTLRKGEVITADNVVHITESDLYLRFKDDNAARKRYLQTISTAVAEKVMAGDGSTSALLVALRTATNEARLSVWSAVPEEQALLSDTQLGHEVSRTTGPYASVVANNGAGSKLDYYLGRSLSYTAGSCSAAQRQSVVTVELQNRAPMDPLPESVTGPPGRNSADSPNANRLLVSLYATQGAQLTKISVDGEPITARPGMERGHPVFTVTLIILPQTTRRLVFDLVEPSKPGAPTVPVQPLADPMDVTVSVPDCARA